MYFVFYYVMFDISHLKDCEFQSLEKAHSKTQWPLSGWDQKEFSKYLQPVPNDLWIRGELWRPVLLLLPILIPIREKEKCKWYQKKFTVYIIAVSGPLGDQMTPAHPGLVWNLFRSLLKIGLFLILVSVHSKQNAGLTYVQISSFLSWIIHLKWDYSVQNQWGGDMQRYYWQFAVSRDKNLFKNIIVLTCAIPSSSILSFQILFFQMQFVKETHLANYQIQFQ